jgi:hypothetical protein
MRPEELAKRLVRAIAVHTAEELVDPTAFRPGALRADVTKPGPNARPVV